MCIIWCTFRFSTREKVLSQIRHLKGLPLLCTLWWFFKVATWRIYKLGISLSSVLFVIKVQITHLKGLSLLCILWWLSKVAAWGKLLSQIRHLKGLSQLCILWWFFKVATWRVYTLEISLSSVLFAIEVQIRHLKDLSLLCILWGLSKVAACGKLSSQIRHLKGLSPLCILWCLYFQHGKRFYCSKALERFILTVYSLMIL